MKTKYFDPKVDYRRQRADTRKGLVVTTVALEREQHERLKRAAAECSTVLTAVVRQAVADWLDRYDRRKGK
jgi:hypothetical protein